MDYLIKRQEDIKVALISCPSCGKEVSDKALACPRCGYDLSKPQAEESTPVVCEECGTEIPENATMCPNCGYPVSNTLKAPPEQIDSIGIGKEVEVNSYSKNGFVVKNIISDVIRQKKHFSKKIIAIISCAVAIVVGIGIFTTLSKLSADENLQVQKVYNQIQQIGNVSLNSESKIEAAEEGYSALTGKCQWHVKNRDELSSARDEYDTLKAGNISSSIKSIGEVTLDRSSAIETARSKYNQLTDAQKGKVTNYSTLEEAETTLNKLEIDNCISIISSIGTVSLDSENKISNALKAYSALSEEQQSQVSNYTDLQKDDETYQGLAIKECISLINQIGKVSLSSEPIITAAETAYKGLNAKSQSQVNNHNLLKAARTEFDKQKAAKAEEERKSALQNTIRVTRVWCSSPNSAGGVDAYVSFTNKSSKTIKYITWTVVPYNAVGDIVESEIGNTSTANLSDTGPYKTGQGHGSGWYWDCIWYNSTITSIKLTNIEIEYTDGTSKTISGNDINYVRY